MNHLETLIEEYKGELAELEKAYHTFTDVVGNHCEIGAIVKAIQEQIVELGNKIYSFTLMAEVHNEQFKGDKEFDPEY